LGTLEKFKNEGISIGMFLMPVIPFITDKPKLIEETIKRAREVDVDFIIFSGMTLKTGRQMDYFYDVLNTNYNNLITEYHNIYRGDKWGGAISDYSNSIHKTFDKIASKYKIPKRVPQEIYADILNKNDLVIVILEQIDYLLKLKGKKSPFGFAAYSISKLKIPLQTMLNNLDRIKGVGETTEKIINEILENGKSSYLEKIMDQ
jgi:DNA repair photolyase